ncbi:hypothetical protein EIP91_002504 [Steccherinum ochraceum]|uniref:F-box domain-containing protein n=1 Tax=Steccherinum ochraceum TaxID=92696 RepID=A0A4R0RBY0_9APHY|nr:hypothetical protein EIP91_002504 [Steccherinum ochraceum]
MMDAQAVVKFIPDDLFEKILLEADLQSIMRCRRAAKWLNLLVEQSTRLQYQLELAVENMEDGFPNSLPIAERLTKLRDRRRAWNTMSFKEKRIINRPHDVELHVRSVPMCITGYDARADPKDPQGVISITRMQDGRLKDSWKVSMRDVVVGKLKHLLLYEEHELLVLFEHRDDDWIIHFRCWTTGTAHPRAFQSSFQAGTGVLAPIPGSLGFHVGMQVIEEYTVIDWDALDGYRRLIIYNWNNGEVVANIFSKSSFEFMLMSQRYLLVVYDSLSGPLRLCIVDLHSSRRATEVSVKKLQTVCQLRLPEKGGRFTVTYMHFASRSTDAWGRSAGVRPAASFSSASQIITLVVGYHQGPRDGRTHEEEEYTLLIPPSVLFDCIDKAQDGPRSFSWDEWGQQNTRLVRTLTPSRMDFFCPGGLRAIAYGDHLDPEDGHPTDTGSVMELELYDFAPLAVRKHQTDLELGRAEQGVELSVCWEYGPSAVFKSQDLTSTLPALITDDGLEVDYELENRFEDHLLTF